MKRFKRVLIANRGEIAARIVRTAKRLGLTSVVGYSDADRATLAVSTAVEAYRLGASPAQESYLDIERILAFAKEHRIDAIHPGYGFLSENSDFARRVLEAGLIWIGPKPEAMDRVSSKAKAKELALSLEIPVSPGFQGSQKTEKLVSEARKIGLPILIKASAGGGGRGIRKVTNESELPSMLEAARSEAKNSFGDGELILEKYIEDAHHVEVQIFGDETGQIVHLGERDCSVQRRHQKIVEESPSSAITPELRRKICDAAVLLAGSAGYTNAGTVEFLVTPKGEYYFLEMNTRLQVEHPVTELVTGLDLVEWQFRIANGEKLPASQNEIEFRGHAIQARLYAEDPTEDYRPQTGRIEFFRFSPRARNDHFLTKWTSVSPCYDAMLAKIIVHAPSRPEAIAQLKAALAETLIVPVKTNLELLSEVLGSDRFESGRFFTRTLDQTPLKKDKLEPLEAAALAAMILYLASLEKIEKHLRGWSTRPLPALIGLRAGDTRYSFEILDRIDSIELRTGDRRFAFEKSFEIPFYLSEGSVFFNRNGAVYRFENALAASERRDEANANEVLSPIDGVVIRVAVSDREQVKRNQVVAVVEAMKMQMELRAPRDGAVESISTKIGAQVKNRQVLLKLTPLDGTRS